MIVLNFTGLKRAYWLPVIEGQGAGDVWYIAIRWLGVEMVAYSVEMATRFIYRLNQEDQHGTGGR